MWDAGDKLALGDEAPGGRPWLGTYYLVAVYGRALTPEEVNRNFQVGVKPVNPTAPRIVGWQGVSKRGAAEELQPLTEGCIEPRAGGLNTIRATLSRPVVASTVTKQAVKVTGSKSGDLAAKVGEVSLDASGRVITIAFSSLPNAERIKIELLPAIRDPWGQPVQNIVLPFAVKPSITVAALVGDVDGSGKVDDADVHAVRARVGQPLAAAKEPTVQEARAMVGQPVPHRVSRYDVDGSGDITDADVKMVQQHAGESLP